MQGAAVYSRVLKPEEVYSLLGHGRFPTDILGFDTEVSGDVRGLEPVNRRYDPAVLVETQGTSLRCQVVLKHPSRADAVQLSESLVELAARGYTIVGIQWIAVDVDALAVCVAAIRDAGLLAHELPTSISLRQFQTLQRSLGLREVALLDRVDKKDLITHLESKLLVAEVEVPSTIKLELYPYQREGLRWLQFCYRHDLGCLLGDDMGLGKTATAIALMASTVVPERPSLVVCPATLLANWLRECQSVCPSLTVALHHGVERLLRPSEFLAYNVVVTSYATARNDIALLSSVPWNVVILDEAQKIKNPDSGVSAACRTLRSKCAVAMTGTPFENSPLDLWSLMDFVEPGFLGPRHQFEAEQAKAIGHGDEGAIHKLESSIRLFMLRRRKRDVLAELPEKLEVDQPVIMTQDEADCYRREVAKLRAEAKLKGASVGLLTSLRQFCCHPRLRDKEWSGDPVQGCSKYARFVEILAEINDAGEKAIVFAPYTRMLDVMEEDIPARFGTPVFRIDGGVPIADRQNLVDAFSAVNGPATMVLNPVAGGVGLNIVAANHVIHYSREWNPAVEDQATDRAFRIGQKRNVIVHYLFYSQTIDEIVSDRLSQKRELAGRLIGVSGDKEDEQRALLLALELIPTRTIEDVANDSSH